MALKLITRPSVEPISLAEAKAHLRVDHDDEDDLIEQLVAAATQHIDGKDGWLQRALVTQTWELWLDSFPCNEIRIPLPPPQSLESIKYDDGDGNEQTYPPDKYTFDSVSSTGWVIPSSSQSWPTTFTGVNAVRIRFIAGYEPSADSPPDLRANVPAPIKAAIKLIVGHLYRNRETVVVGDGAVTVEVPQTAEWLLAPYRVYV